jgi:putative membrane protein
VLLTMGWIFIRRGNVAWHRRMMLAAFAMSALFLMSYVIYHANVGSKPYTGTGALRVVYFTILIPHVILAAAVLPLQFITLFRGLRMDRVRHRAIARITLPIWLYVSVTGVAVYVMLYGAR